MNIYAELWHHMHTSVPTSRLCEECGAPLQVRTDRQSGKPVALNIYPHPDGEWQIAADLYVYRATFPMHAYTIHTCEEES